jgi:hypothetical protein
MTLNLKNYIGFEKKPYCNAHNPSKRLQAAQVSLSDTPEGRRLQGITKLNSQAEYRREFEQQKGQMISTVDDPSMMMAKQASMNASGYGYRSGSTGQWEAENDAEGESYQATPYANPGALPSSGGRGSQSTQGLYRAIYDYDAQDQEEVSFREGEIIENFTIIDEGWGTGTVQSTGQNGMIPSNYVEQM